MTFSEYATQLQKQLTNKEFNHLLKNMSISDFWIKKVSIKKVVKLVKEELNNG